METLKPRRIDKAQAPVEGGSRYERRHEGRTCSATSRSSIARERPWRTETPRASSGETRDGRKRSNPSRSC